MQLTLYGTRGSFPYAGEKSSEYGQNTSCVAIQDGDELLILDAGTGILRIPQSLLMNRKRVDILLTHLHIDHIQGLGFFKPMFNPNCEVNIWGPLAYNKSLKERLNRYLSPPLFPVHFRDLPCNMKLHEIGRNEFNIGNFLINTDFICHPGPTVAFRVTNGKKTIAYFPDHEPAISPNIWKADKSWLSGAELAEGVDVLMHDSQFTDVEYSTRVGWGHSTFKDALRFGKICNVKKLLLFHHDPDHNDEQLESIYQDLMQTNPVDFEVILAKESDIIEL